jgi:hypothetical protein
MELTQSSETSVFNTQTPGKYPEDNLSLLQHGKSLKTRNIILVEHTGSGRSTRRFDKTVVSGTVGMGNLSLSALLARLKAFQLPWSVICTALGFCCGNVFKKQRFPLDSEDI